MNFRIGRYVFYFTWLGLLFIPFITVTKNTSFVQAIENPILLTNFFQRITGLLAFTLLFMQIMIGSHMTRFLQIIGAKAYKLHITQGLITYGLVLIHPFLYFLINYQISNNLFTSLLVILPSFKNQTEIFLVFGKVAFTLLTISVCAAYFRTKPLFRRNWRAFHILNYLVFFLILIHARVGTDFTTPPFLYVYWLATILVSGTVIYKIASPLVNLIISKLKVTDKEEEKA